jgi:hypothetical protein
LPSTPFPAGISLPNSAIRNALKSESSYPGGFFTWL